MLKKTWKQDNRPSNSDFLINKVWLSDGHKNILKSLNVDDSFFVNIEYEVIKNNTKVGLNVILHDNNQNIISSSINNLEKKFYNQKHNLGLYSSTCKIPGMLFNTGIFFISIYMFGSNFRNTKMVEYALKVELEDGVEVRGDYHGKYEVF